MIEAIEGTEEWMTEWRSNGNECRAGFFVG